MQEPNTKHPAVERARAHKKQKQSPKIEIKNIDQEIDQMYNNNQKILPIHRKPLRCKKKTTSSMQAAFTF